jgi:UDP-sugar transporter A1/2/3
MIVKTFHGSRSDVISKTTIVVATELSKILIATGIISSNPTMANETKKVIKNFNFIESLKLAAIPATLYAIQNLLNQHAYQLLDATTFNLMNQTKTLSAAFWCYMILNKPQSSIQVIALLLLLGAAIILNVNLSNFFGNTSLSDDNSNNINPLGLSCVIAASGLSGLSAALTQRALSVRPSYFFSSELAVYGILFLMCNAAYKNDLSSVSYKMFNDWTLNDYIPILTNAFGGLVIGQVTKYAGGVRKGFALIAGILVTVVAESMICNPSAGVTCKTIDLKTCIAFALVSLSIYLHSTFPPKKISTDKKND